MIRLRDVGEIVSGVTLGRSLPEGPTRSVPYLRVANVKDSHLALNDVREIEVTNAEFQRWQLREGDLLLTEGGDPDKLGRGAVWKQQLPECIHQNHIFRVRLDPTAVLPEFASAEIASPYGKSYFVRHAKRTTGIATINQKVLGDFPLMVPVIAEQRRILALLDEQMAMASWALAAAKERLGTARLLSSSCLEQALRTRDSTAWPRMRLADLLAAPLKTGISRAATPNSSKRCLTLSAVRNGALDLAASKLTEVSKLEAQGNWVLPGAFYVVRGNGNRSLVGRGGFAPQTVEPNVLFPDLLIQVVTDSKVIVPEYLRFVWDSHEVRRDLESRARTAAGIYKISQGNLAEVKVPLPSVRVQRQVAESLKGELARAEEAQAGIGEQLMRIAALPAALLRRAFAAQL